MNDLCLVYLARAKTGMEPFQRFLEALRRFPPGAPHDFLIVFKGFRNSSEIDDWLQAAREFAPRKLTMRDFGFDLDAYRLAAQTHSYEWFCFLNSFSEPLAERWLEKLFSVAQTKNVGLAGATGSYESMYTNALMERDTSPTASPVSALRMKVRIAVCARLFPPMPNPHIRSNAFITSRARMLQVWPGHIFVKRAAYLFENGKNSLTRRIERMGLEVMVVGKDGRAYPKADWPSSRAFRMGTQENLLVADNQTRLYDLADPATRERLSKLAWGPDAR